MIAAITIDGPQGSRRVGADRFPLSLGGPGSDVELPGLADPRTVAWLGLADGDLFVQSTGEDGTVLSCNGAVVTASQWLRDGDVVGVGPARLRVAAGDEIRLRIDPPAAEDETEPPVVTPARELDTSTATTIRPLRFEPRASVRAGRRKFAVRVSGLTVWAAMLALGASAWFVFSLRSVEIRVDPSPDRLRLEGGWFEFELGGRYLLRSGEYRVLAEKAGFRPLDRRVTVGRLADQSFRFTLERLPDRLAVDTGTVVGAQVSIDGEPVGTTPLEPIALGPGEHRVRVELDRFEVFEKVVTAVGGGATIELPVALRPLWAEVSMVSDPPGARVRVDGEELGATPLRAELMEGRHRYELYKSGYKTFLGSVEVRAGQSVELAAAHLVPTDGIVRLTSEPAGASVTVDGRYRGETPIELAVAAGREVELRLTMAGYDPASRRVSCASGQTAEAQVTLRERIGEIVVQATPSDASLLVDGDPRGAANQTLRLLAVPHTIEVRREGYETFSTTVTPKPGYAQSLPVTLKTAAQLEAERRPPQIRDAVGQELVLVEGGRFRMGAPRREPGRRSNEVLRDVELDRPFYIARTEVSNRDFRRFQTTHLSGKAGDSSLENDRHPAVRVSWEEAALFCNWLSEQESLPAAYERVGGRIVAVRPLTEGYRLPTEAEWAWVARYPGGSGPLKYPWGGSLPVPAGSGNFADESSRDLLSTVIDGYNDGYPTTAPVDSFAPDAHGVYNLGGNVAEWVNDFYAIHGRDDGTPEIDPIGPEEGELHVIRGSSWMDASVSELRLSFRDYGKEGRPDVGFRVARYADRGTEEK